MLTGTLEDFALPDVLRLVSAAHKTGMLRVESPAGSGSLFFRDGAIYYAETTVPVLSVGERLVDEGLLSDIDLDDAIAHSRDTGRSVSEILTARTLLTDPQLRKATEARVYDVGFELMRWGEGRFEWFAGREVRPEINAAVGVDDIIVEAAHRLDDLAVRERSVVAEDSIPSLSSAFASAASPITISPDQWRILALLDGRRSARQVALLAGLDVEDGLRDLVRLVSSGVVEVRPGTGDAPAGGSAPVRAAAPPMPPPVPQGKEGSGFAAFQQAAMASARSAEPDPDVIAEVRERLASPATPIETFDTPGVDEMSTKLPDSPLPAPSAAPEVAAPPPPPPPAPAWGPGDTGTSVAGMRIDDETSRQITSASQPPDGRSKDDAVDPALIARLIRGVKEL